MTELEEGEWVRYKDYKEETEILRMERDSYRDMYKDTLNNYCAMTKKYHEEQNLTDHYRFRVDVLFTVLMGTYGVIVAKLIVWSLGVL
jgi:uncharacterized protein YydD (DUF2326 family)